MHFIILYLTSIHWMHYLCASLSFSLLFSLPVCLSLFLSCQCLSCSLYLVLISVFTSYCLSLAFPRHQIHSDQKHPFTTCASINLILPSILHIHRSILKLPKHNCLWQPKLRLEHQQVFNLHCSSSMAVQYQCNTFKWCCYEYYIGRV